MKRICVFCGSSLGGRPSYREAAARMGRTLAQHRIGLVYGGASVGLMGILADATLDAGGLCDRCDPGRAGQEGGRA